MTQDDLNKLAEAAEKAEGAFAKGEISLKELDEHRVAYWEAVDEYDRDIRWAEHYDSIFTEAEEMPSPNLTPNGCHHYQ